jgi:hypothetical protein
MEHDPIEAELVSDGRGPEYYPVRRPLWARFLIWMGETERGQTFVTVVLGLPTMLAMGWAFSRWRWDFVIWFFSVTAAFVAGWNLARRRWLKDGWIDRL